jgi:four helix bundle protein
MEYKTKQLLDRTFGFGVAVLRFIATLPSNESFRVPKHQAAKASTSIGANYEEAQAAESKADFIHKIGISLKESRECLYWLRMIHALLEDTNKRKTTEKLIEEAAEYVRIFASIKLTAEGTKRQ